MNTFNDRSPSTTRINVDIKYALAIIVTINYREAVLLKRLIQNIFDSLEKFERIAVLDPKLNDQDISNGHQSRSRSPAPI